MVTDQGTQFEAEVFYKLSKLSGVKDKSIIAYHSQGNVLVERWHHTLKDIITCHSDATEYQFLPTVLLFLSTTIHEDVKATSSEWVLGENLRFQLLYQLLHITHNRALLSSLQYFKFGLLNLLLRR
ncbi:hypothetical protein TNCV_4014811 [Trichonephila clavipes]|uniref:Integrase catalytic domain-containing protein n=1 Tax=Trichonephila clavipes TaxID=2585209 RepID=A0A8X6RHX8_TRICX|nr:hypothetical protein TNCV_4014811 [Trichonephila clavipes]